jgi:hypothetical protein
VRSGSSLTPLQHHTCCNPAHHVATRPPTLQPTQLVVLHRAAPFSAPPASSARACRLGHCAHPDALTPAPARTRLNHAARRSPSANADGRGRCGAYQLALGEGLLRPERLRTAAARRLARVRRRVRAGGRTAAAAQRHAMVGVPWSTMEYYGGYTTIASRRCWCVLTRCCAVLGGTRRRRRTSIGRGRRCAALPSGAGQVWRKSHGIRTESPALANASPPSPVSANPSRPRPVPPPPLFAISVRCAPLRDARNAAAQRAHDDR